MIEKKKVILVCILLASICFSAYSPFLYTPFLNDDTQWLGIIHSKRFVPGYWWKVFLFEPDSSFERFYNPLTLIVFDVWIRIAGETPLYLRLFCIAVHACNSLMLYLILKKLLKADYFFALLGAIWFSVSAIHSQAVIWICNMHDTLGVFCLLLLIYLFYTLKNNQIKYVVCAVCVIAGMCFKETFLMSAYYLIFWDWFVMKKRRILPHMIFAGITFLYLYFKITGYGGIGGYDRNGIGFINIAHCIKTVSMYLYYAFIPCQPEYKLLTVFLAACTLLAFTCCKGSDRIKIAGACLLFIFPILFTENDLSGRYFYSLTPAVVLALCSFNSRSRLRNRYWLLVCSIIGIIAANIFILTCEIYPYQLCTNICSEIYSFKNTIYEKVLFFNVPYNIIINSKPSPMRYFPCGGIDTGYIEQKQYNVCIMSLDNYSDHKFKDNNWNYDSKNKILNLKIGEEYLNWRFFESEKNKTSVYIDDYLKHSWNVLVFNKKILRFQKLQ